MWNESLLVSMEGKWNSWIIFQSSEILWLSLIFFWLLIVLVHHYPLILSISDIYSGTDFNIDDEIDPIECRICQRGTDGRNVTHRREVLPQINQRWWGGKRKEKKRIFMHSTTCL